MTSSNTKRPAAASTANGPHEIDLAGGSISPRGKRPKAGNQAVTPIAVVDKSPSAQVRIGITSRRGSHKLELRDATATIPGVYMPTPNHVTLDIAKLPELIAALQVAEAQAISHGMIGRSER